MLRVERIEIGEGARYGIEVRGAEGVIFKELVNLCNAIHKELAPSLSAESFMKLIGIAIKENEPDEVNREEIDDSSEFIN